MSSLTEKVTLYLEGEGYYLKKRGKELQLWKGEEKISQIPAFKLSNIVALGNAGISSGVVELCREEGINVQFLTKAGRFCGELVFDPSRNLHIRKEQMIRHLDQAVSLEIARRFVKGKINNMQWFLDTFRAGNVLPPHSADSAANFDELNGCEGNATREYFAFWPSLLKNGDFPFIVRTKNPPEDRMNSLLSFFYTILLNDIHSICNRVGLDPYFGFLHKNYYGRPSLACDLIEEWRPMVDKFVLTVVNRGEIALEDFELESNQIEYHLTKDGFKNIIVKWSEYYRRAERVCPHFHIMLTRMGSVERQVRHFAQFISGDSPEYLPYLMKEGF